MAKWVLRYLKGLKDVGIIYRRGPQPGDTNIVHPDVSHMIPWAFCDANYMEDPHDRKSTSRYVFMFTGSPIVWKLKKQTSVALSTTEAEYYALGVACQEAVWGMVPTAQSPPSVQSADTAIATTPPLDEIIHKLHDFILQIPLPKTKTAKTAAIG